MRNQLRVLIPLVIFFACDEEAPVFESGTNVGIPAATGLVSHCEGECTSSTVTLSWGGNEATKAYRYRLELSADDVHNYPFEVDTYTSWSEWSNLNSVTFYYLDEGKYNFSVQGRFNVNLVQTGSTETTFDVNAIADAVTALRIYPLRQKVTVGGTTISVNVYAENIGSLLAAEIDLQYDESKLEYISSSSGCGDDDSDLPDEESSSTITKLYCDSDGTYTANVSLFNLQFNRIGDGDAWIEIKSSSRVGDNTGDYYEVEIRKDGLIEIY